VCCQASWGHIQDWIWLLGHQSTFRLRHWFCLLVPTKPSSCHHHTSLSCPNSTASCQNCTSGKKQIDPFIPAVDKRIAQWRGVYAFCKSKNSTQIFPCSFMHQLISEQPVAVLHDREYSMDKAGTCPAPVWFTPQVQETANWSTS
jgi:hypothetical protein